MNSTIRKLSRIAYNPAVLKAVIFLLFIVAAVILINFTPAQEYFSDEALERLMKRAGIWAPIVYVAVYIIGVCLFVPATLLTVVGAAIFGAYWGFLYAWAGALLGGVASFLIGRTLGRQFAQSLIGNRLKKYDDAIERNGFATVLYLRLIYLHFTVMNMGIGLTKIKFWDYFFGTALGIVLGTFIFTYFVGLLREAWITGNWEILISVKMFFSICLVIFLLFVPKIAKKIKGESE
ncbi:MAG: TVP38/TMEM64 family protein [Syntrophales bacterium]|jgi:uncharacterized membrane protein YdjX (TVP38/TMEM64 family)|nr:TVP38/TMEM64 family protein [Syntrophales bacterium]MDY0045262.1 TVP38/TMEM64 family protein [Syntrophales bacterium]